MKTNAEQAKEEVADVVPENNLFGKIMGIVENQQQLETVSEALLQLGVTQVEILDGDLGIKDLNGEQQAVSQFFLGDMEEEMVKRYLEAVTNGMIVFAAVVDPSKAAEAATKAKELGAAEIVHFGTWVITNY